VLDLLSGAVPAAAAAAKVDDAPAPEMSPAQLQEIIALQTEALVQAQAALAEVRLATHLPGLTTKARRSTSSFSAQDLPLDAAGASALPSHPD
jgi:hypothetical protein